MKLEPSTQLKLFGHHNLFSQLVKLESDNRLPNKILLSGQKGIGKSTLAYHLINFILSKDEDHKYDFKNYEINIKNKSYRLLLNKSNPNFYLVDVANDKKIIDISQIRDLISNLNKSSFNTKKRFVLIDNIELLNTNSVNALLRFLEEPNANINFILINNHKNIFDTLKSRCLDFNMTLTYQESLNIINNLINEDVFDLVNHELIDNYITPGKLLKFVHISHEQKIDIKSMNLEIFLSTVIRNKLYKKEKLFIGYIYSYMELYFRNKVSVRNINFYYLYNHFLKKVFDTKNYNLDEESLFIEFEEKVLHG